MLKKERRKERKDPGRIGFGAFSINTQNKCNVFNICLIGFSLPNFRTYMENRSHRSYLCRDIDSSNGS